jgi:hypothetical protein
MKANLCSTLLEGPTPERLIGDKTTNDSPAAPHDEFSREK